MFSLIISNCLESTKYKNFHVIKWCQLSQLLWKTNEVVRSTYISLKYKVDKKNLSSIHFKTLVYNIRRYLNTNIIIVSIATGFIYPSYATFLEISERFLVKEFSTWIICRRKKKFFLTLVLKFRLKLHMVRQA